MVKAVVGKPTTYSQDRVGKRVATALVADEFVTYPAFSVL